MNSQIRFQLLSKSKGPGSTSSQSTSSPRDSSHNKPEQGSPDLGIQRLKSSYEAKAFKLIDDKDWNIASTEPSSETTFFADGHSAMSIISVIGPRGSGKSSLLNKIARKEVFQTNSSTNKADAFNVRHVTRGIDIYATYYRMLLDCQPLLASSILEDYLTGRSDSQFSKNSRISDPFVSCHMISLQLATFLVATCDYLIILVNWLIDVHFLKLISTAIMMVGENNLRVRFIIYSEDQRVDGLKFKSLIDSFLGSNRVERYFSQEQDLIDYILAYSREKCDLFHKDSSTFTGKNWLASCQRLWNTNIKNSPMFAEYAQQYLNASS